MRGLSKVASVAVCAALLAGCAPIESTLRDAADAGIAAAGSSGIALELYTARFMHRGSFLVPWEDVARIGRERVELREGYRKERSTLPSEGSRS